MNNAIILADKRTGSTFLQECLNSHPNITCYDEMFMRGNKEKRRGQYLYNYMKRTKNMNHKQYLKWLFSNEGAICFRLMYPHLDNNKPLFDVIRNERIPIIHLIRKNHLNHFISSQTKQQQKVNLDVNNIVNNLNFLNNKIEFHRKQFKTKTEYMEIYYEDMFGEIEGKKKEAENYGAFNIKSKQITYLSDKYVDKICKFLGVENKDLYSNVTKRNSWNIWKHIKNEQQAKQALKESKWEGLINDN